MCDELQGVATDALDGFNVCVMAYGATGAGKTHTMMGPAHDRGVSYQVMRALMAGAGARPPGTSYTWRLSPIDVFNVHAPAPPAEGRRPGRSRGRRWKGLQRARSRRGGPEGLRLHSPWFGSCAQCNYDFIVHALVGNRM